MAINKLFSYSVASVLCLEVDELRAVVPLLGDSHGVVVWPVEVVHLCHDGDQAEEPSGSIDVAGVEDDDVSLAVTNGSHAFEVTRSSGKDAFKFHQRTGQIG